MSVPRRTEAKFTPEWIDQTPFTFRRFDASEEATWPTKLANTGDKGCISGNLQDNGSGKWTVHSAPCDQQLAFICKGLPRRSPFGFLGRFLSRLFGFGRRYDRGSELVEKATASVTPEPRVAKDETTVSEITTSTDSASTELISTESTSTNKAATTISA